MTQHDPDDWYWCEECEDYFDSDDPCDCVIGVDIDASPEWLRRLNPELDLDWMDD